MDERAICRSIITYPMIVSFFLNVPLIFIALYLGVTLIASADFVVCPHFDKETIKLCNLYQDPCFPGGVSAENLKDCSIKE
ncbi:hypothetical protein [Dubosiella newyorkensis]|uniref:hypothetical protein n=1 Tax=Dubosiella newyorkensis TaxID=1862672 RepID=UPI0023F5528B|nr:hypothetical protein [Dubosiella newyorkensis]